MKYKITIGLFGVVFSMLAHSAVEKIEKYGKSASGSQIYRVTCTDGATHRYYWHGGEWRKAGLGSVGHKSKSLEELARWRCR